VEIKQKPFSAFKVTIGVTMHKMKAKVKLNEHVGLSVYVSNKI